ncbi:hypothetical protein ACJJIK_07750 [Microbulbifer sp. ZKSA006]|uniref:hypothetical protein n=1 Tax=Microbulbifer sp. ZKSA006 TaxID=3243390 RepID=UPI0040394798
MFVWIVEVIGAVLIFFAFSGLILGCVFFFIKRRDLQSLLILIGLVITESGRLFRLYGPSYMLETGEVWIKLTDGSSQMVFILSNLSVPLGIFIVMIGFLSLSWSEYKNK